MDLTGVNERSVEVPFVIASVARTVAPDARILDVGAGPTVIGTLGTQAEIKGTDLVMEAFGLLEGHPDSRLHIVGTVDPSYEDTLKVIAERLGVEDRVAILGHVDADAYDEAIGEIDVAVQLRRGTNGEVSAAVGDCLRRGVPTIVTDLGPNHDLPDDIVVKVPVDVGASELAEAIDTVLSDTEGSDRLARSALSYVEAHNFDWAAEALLNAVLPAFAGDEPKSAGPPETIGNGRIQRRPAPRRSMS
jgi:glycosyltransferase involved in cell wall biosynthesis